jgi:hypothetical protein
MSLPAGLPSNIDQAACDHLTNHCGADKSRHVIVPLGTLHRNRLDASLLTHRGQDGS